MKYISDLSLEMNIDGKIINMNWGKMETQDERTKRLKNEERQKNR